MIVDGGIRMKRLVLTILTLCPMFVLIGCNDSTEKLREDAEEALLDGDISLAKTLYEHVLDEAPDDEESTVLVDLLADYETFLEKIEALEWYEAERLGEKLVDNEHIPYALKREVKQYVELIEEGIALVESINNTLAKVDNLIEDGELDEAKKLLDDLKKEKDFSKLTTLKNEKHEQILEAERKLAEKEKEALEKERAELERKKAEQKEKTTAKTTVSSSGSLKQQYLAKAEEVAKEEQELIEIFNAISSSESRGLAKQCYDLWDDLINEVWGVIKEQLPESEFEQLRQAQIKWIQEKEALYDELNDEQYGLLAIAEAYRAIQEMTIERTYYLINNYLD